MKAYERMTKSDIHDFMHFERALYIATVVLFHFRDQLTFARDENMCTFFAGKTTKNANLKPKHYEPIMTLK